ncbi:hypothetical protein N0V82_008563 [Gnomoniopsis sp. IMI 355080]|nr:hypothetical protein N0V82_008563 [Gnomoniopsis sp. IMI 355080]
MEMASDVDSGVDSGVDSNSIVDDDIVELSCSKAMMHMCLVKKKWDPHNLCDTRILTITSSLSGRAANPDTSTNDEK